MRCSAIRTSTPCSPTQHRIAAMLHVEVALARAEAAAGVIPARAVDAIAQSADVADYDLHALSRARPLTSGNLAIPLVQRLTEHVAPRR